MMLRASCAPGVGSRFPLRLVLPVLLLCLVLPAPALASQVRTLDLNEMTARADRVFRGRCVHVEVRKDPRLGRLVTHVTFQVDRAAKGDLGKTVTIRLLGDQEDVAGRPAGIAGLPRFRAGEEVILFLYPDSGSGLTSPVGFGQGKFDLVKDKQGRSLAVNQLGNRNLLRQRLPSPARVTREPAVAGEGTPARPVSPEAASAGSRHRNGIPPDVLLDQVKRLER
jgi:hypothetical protein